jgi:leader peptidase (prepilin peptidase)/N-methyltransferase
VTVASAGPLGPGGPEDEPTGWSDPEPAEPWTLVPASTSGWVERVVVTVVTGALLGLAAYRLGAVPQLGAYCALFVGLVAISAVDLRVGLVPRKILYPTFVLMTIGLVGASAALDAWTPMLHAVIAGVAAFALFFAIWWFHPRGLGFGDVRLAGVMGAGLGWLGLPEAYLGFLAAFLIGALYGLVVMAVQRSGRRTRIAFGPALAAGAVIGVLWGPTLAQTWLHSSGG